MAQAFSISYGELAAMMNAALRDVFTMMLHSSIKLEPWTEPPTVASGVEKLFGNDTPLIVSNIGFSGDIFGFVYLFMGHDTADFIASRMLKPIEGGKHPVDIVNDAIGEFTNISIGGFKNQLSQFGFPCSLTLPSILRGKSLSVEPVSGCVRKTFVFMVRGKPILSLLIIKED